MPRVGFHPRHPRLRAASRAAILPPTMNWHALWLDLWTILRDHWLKAIVSLVFLFIGTAWGKRRARREWANKRFVDRINFSLNTIADGALQIRTIAEMNCRDVFLNEVATEAVLAATARTTEKNALLPFDKDERWFLLNAVLNELSERFAAGFVRRDMGLPVTTRPYLVCLTYENSGDLKTRKVRAMIVQRATLLNLPAEMPRLERPHHSVRFQTLQQLAAAYQSDPTQFLEVELSL